MRGPADAGAWERLGRLRLRLLDREGALHGARARAGAGRRRGGARTCWREALAIEPTRARAAPSRSRPYRMLTARETIRPIVTSETSDWTPITTLGHRRERHRVGGGEGGGVGERHVQVVDELRTPVERLDAIVVHLREQEVGSAVVPGGAPARPAAIELPVPQAEDQEVGQPDEHARDDQPRGRWRRCGAAGSGSARPAR